MGTSDIVAAAALVAADLGDDRGTLSCGLRCITRYLGGYVPGDMAVYAGRTSVGKSHLVLAALRGCAVAGEPALYISLEDPPRRVRKRLAAGYTADKLYVTFPSKSTGALVRVLRQAHAKYGIVHFAVDYAQKLRYDGDVQVWSKPDMMDVAITALEDTVASLGGVLHLVSQVNRPERDADPDALPKLYSMSESSAIEKAADVVLILGNVKGRPVVEIAKAKDARVPERFALVRNPTTGVLTEPDDTRESDDERGNSEDDW